MYHQRAGGAASDESHKYGQHAYNRDATRDRHERPIHDPRINYDFKTRYRGKHDIRRRLEKDTQIREALV